MSQVNLLVVDDHPLFRTALETIVRKMDINVEVSQAKDLDEAKQILEDGATNLVLLDLQLGETDTTDLIPGLRERYPATAFLVISNYQETDRIQKVLQYGARGFIPKSANGDTITNGIQIVLGGGIFLPDDVLAAMAANQSEEGAATKRSKAPGNLTKRQYEVLQQLGTGATNAQIAKELGISEATAKLHVRQLLRRLGVRNRTEAVVKSNKMGILMQEAG